VKSIHFLHRCILVANTKRKGRGVFTNEPLDKGVTIEVAPVIVMSNENRLLLDKTLLHDYIFEWGHDKKQCCIALGYIVLYNHAYKANCEYDMNFQKGLITIRTFRAIKKGEELLINYNGDFDNPQPVWFDVK
jgi:SET domain-containing protein